MSTPQPRETGHARPRHLRRESWLYKIASQGAEHRGVGRPGTGASAIELAVSAVILTLVGLVIDQLAGTSPLFTLVLFSLGAVGASVSLWYRYTAEMERQEAEAPWRARR